MFNLEITNLCYSSKILEKNIYGLKSLIEIIRNIKFKKYSFLSLEFIVKKIKKKNQMNTNSNPFLFLKSN